MVEFVWNSTTQRFPQQISEITNEKNLRAVKRERNVMKKSVIDEYMKHYNSMIDKTIKAHNEKIYYNLTSFLKDSTDKL